MIGAMWIIIIKLFTNPWVIITIILSILADLLYPKFRGFMGEFWVKKELEKLSKNKYRILNDIMIKDEFGNTHQIDHVVISRYGIFVIEMKNYYGLIVGKNNNSKWIQYLGKRKYYFNNPIYQNYGHVKALQELLKIDNNLFIPILCFSNQAKLKIENNKNITQLDYLKKLIESYQDIIIDDDIDNIVELINMFNITIKKERKKHIRNIKKRITDDNIKVNNMICPKCGSILIERKGKYGAFVGCSNYPKCKYINKYAYSESKES